MKKLKQIHTNKELHWVGDGFPVRNIFSYNEFSKELSPFLMMDYAGPTRFSATEKKLGVGEHPHRGFETVTIIYDGEVEHRDSGGGGGLIRKGEVQWMTAGSGVVHEEYHGHQYSKTGGPFEMVQLWVNLPQKDKMTKPRYQALTNDLIPEISLPNGAGAVRLFAGQYGSKRGPAQTFSPMNLWDMRLVAGTKTSLEIPEGHTAALFVLSGTINLPSGEKVDDAYMAIFEKEGDSLEFASSSDAKVLLMSGQAIDEPVVGYGPFVMNTKAEISQAIEDYQTGKMGHLH